MRFLSTLLMLGFIFVSPAHVHADDSAMKEAIRNSFAVIDVQRVLSESKAAVSIQKQIEEKHKEYQKVIAREEKTLRDAERELSQQRTLLDADAYAEKRKEFEQRVAKVQRDVQNKKRELEGAFAKSMEQVQNQMVQLIGELAEERGLIAIFPRSQILLVENALDVTEVVMTQLDKKLPTVKVTVKAVN
jgi:Skp family chaperone for outer membrane proteins